MKTLKYRQGPLLQQAATGGHPATVWGDHVALGRAAEEDPGSPARLPFQKPCCWGSCWDVLHEPSSCRRCGGPSSAAPSGTLPAK